MHTGIAIVGMAAIATMTVEVAIDPIETIAAARVLRTVEGAIEIMIEGTETETETALATETTAAGAAVAVAVVAAEREGDLGRELQVCAAAIIMFSHYRPPLNMIRFCNASLEGGKMQKS